MKRPIRKLLRALFNYDPSFYDMYQDPNARSDAQEYLDRITHILKNRSDQKPLSILDAGCQTGRLLIPLAQLGHQMTGVDTSGFSLRRASQYAKEHKLSIKLHRSNISGMHRWIKPSSVDAVICTEVLYLCPDYQDLIKTLAHTVKSKGFLFISHRPNTYYILRALEKGNVELAYELSKRSEGVSSEGNYHNWQTPEELNRLYDQCGLKSLSCYPVQYIQCALSSKLIIPDHTRKILSPLEIKPHTFRTPTYLFITAQKKAPFQN